MPWIRLPIVLLLLHGGIVDAQFAELAGLATSFLGPGLGGALEGASAGAGALGQIGQLYQLAQAGIGLAGTGVDVLNKASQGNWFPAAIEQATLMQKNMGAMGERGSGIPGGLGGLGGALGALGGLPGLGGGGGGTEIGSEFGKSFPAPSVEDYETDIDLKSLGSTTPAQGLERFFTSTTTRAPDTTTTARSIPITLFPEEEDRDKDENFKPSVKSLPKRKINIILPKSPDYFEAKSTDTESEIEFKTEKDRDYDNLITKEETEESPNTVKERSTRSEKDRIIDLERLIEVLSKNKMKDDEIAEIIKQVESNAGRSEQTSHKDDLDSTVRNISPDMFEKQQRIIKATRDLREHLDNQQKEREQLLVSTEPSTTTETITDPPTYRPLSTTVHTPSSFADFETSTKPTHRPLTRSTSALPLPFSSVQQPWSSPPSSATPFAQVPLSSPSSSSSFLYPSQLYSVSGQAIPPVQQVHPHLTQLPTHPSYFAPSSQFSQVSLPPVPSPPHLPPPPSSSLSSLPTYYTYQNANAHTVTRGTVQLPVSSLPSPLSTSFPSGVRQGRRVRQGAAAATDLRLAAAATRTTVAPARGQQQVSPAVQRRFKGRGEGMTGARRVDRTHGEKRNPQVRAQAAKSHRIFASPLSTVVPSTFPRRMVPTQHITTPSPVRLPSPAPSASSSSNQRRPNHQQQQQFVVSSESRRPSPRPAAAAAGGSHRVTPYWMDSNFVQRFPQQAASHSATGDDLVREEITAVDQRIQGTQERRQLRQEELRELQARLRQY